MCMHAYTTNVFNLVRKTNTSIYEVNKACVTEIVNFPFKYFNQH